MSHAGAGGERAPPRILLLGAGGQVGFELTRALSGLGRIDAPARGELDLSRGQTLASDVLARRPQVIVNAAAYTAVDRAESEPQLARAVNAVAPEILAACARRLGALLVHYSTDYVFDGRASRPYRETDPTAPLGVYGLTKRDGEQAVVASGARALVLRTAWVYGLRGSNFLLTVRRLARERRALRIVADQWGSPTWCARIADATARIVAACLARAPEWSAARGGIYHMTAAGVTSWHGFACAILARDPELADLRDIAVEPIPSSDYPLPARRPRYSVLDNGRLAATFGIVLEDWQAQLAQALAA